jgi:DNA polymerase III subunit epsilon
MNQIVYLDLETTGLDTENDRIIEIGLVNNDLDDDLSLSLLINPGFDISQEIVNITGISNDSLKRAPNFEFYAQDLMDYLQGKYIVGYNILRFDIPLLIAEFQRIELPWDTSKCRFVDLYKVFCKKEPRDLAGALKFYANKKREGGTSHRALDDANDCIDILCGQALRYVQSPEENILDTFNAISMDGLIDFAGKFIYNDKGEPVFNFGKHRGKSVFEEPGMLDWMIGKDFAEDTKQWCKTFLALKSKSQKDDPFI